jgi:hypothetical protein
VEQVLRRLGPTGHPVVLVPVELRGDDERDIGVPEVAEQPFGHNGKRHVIGVDKHDHVIVTGVFPEPAIVIAVLRLVGEGPCIKLQVAPVFTGEVMHAEPLAHLFDLVRVAFIQDPQVELAPVYD